MSDKKIVVPEGMLEAAGKVFDAERRRVMEDRLAWSVFRQMMEAALRWLSENPVVPTLPQMRAVETSAAHEATGSTAWLSDAIMEWQRRMFLAPEPEVPEAITDLFSVCTFGDELNAKVRKAIVEAYDRGQKSK